VNLRKALRLTQGEMAEKLGVSRSCYQKYEYMERKPKARVWGVIDALRKEATETWKAGGMQ
jgi:transcriptional regulator with XRE-family HTH domain